MMKKLFFLTFLSALISFAVSCQDSISKNIDTLPLYKKKTNIPEFKILRTDSTLFTKNDLLKNQPLIIIYFAPDCGHCQYEAKEIVKSIDSLKNAQFLWVSFHPIPEIKDFQKKYHLNKFKNMVCGRDPKYYLPALYKVAFTPYIAIYNQNGLFVKEFRMGATIKELYEALQ